MIALAPGKIEGFFHLKASVHLVHVHVNPN